MTSTALCEIRVSVPSHPMKYQINAPGPGTWTAVFPLLLLPSTRFLLITPFPVLVPFVVEKVYPCIHVLTPGPLFTSSQLMGRQWWILQLPLCIINNNKTYLCRHM